MTLRAGSVSGETVYDRALSPEEIAAHYEGRGPSGRPLCPRCGKDRATRREYCGPFGYRWECMVCLERWRADA